MRNIDMESTNTLPAPEGATIGQAKAIFEEIATLANTLDEHFYFSGDQVVDRDPGEVQNQLDRVRVAIRHIGMLADFGAGCGIRGGVVDWLLPPSFRLTESAESGEAV
jgi:hypothetical protein